MKFERTKEYMRKLFLEAMCDDKAVHQDVRIDIVWNKSKWRAWCEKADSYLQFPNSLRKPRTSYIADVVEVKSEGRSTFFRVVKESIRDMNGDLI